MGRSGGGVLAYQGYRLVLLWRVHVLTEGCNEKKKTSLPEPESCAPVLMEGVKMEPQIKMLGFCNLFFTGRGSDHVHFRLRHSGQMHSWELIGSKCQASKKVT